MVNKAWEVILSSIIIAANYKNIIILIGKHDWAMGRYSSALELGHNIFIQAAAAAAAGLVWKLEPDQLSSHLQNSQFC